MTAHLQAQPTGGVRPSSERACDEARALPFLLQVVYQVVLPGLPTRGPIEMILFYFGVAKSLLSRFRASTAHGMLTTDPLCDSEPKGAMGHTSPCTHAKVNWSRSFLHIYQGHTAESHVSCLYDS